MNCATSCIIVAVGGHDCFTNRHLVKVVTLPICGDGLSKSKKLSFVNTEA